MLDPNKLEEIHKQFYKPLMRYVAHLLIGESHDTIEDLVSETLIKAWTHYDGLKNDDSFTAWIYTIARNKVYDYVRKKKRNPITSLDIPLEFMGEPQPITLADTIPEKEWDSTSSSFLRELDIQEVRHSVACLSKNHRDVIIMHYFQDMEVKEMAEIIGCPHGTIKSRLARARDALHDRLSRKLFPVV